MWPHRVGDVKLTKGNRQGENHPRAKLTEADVREMRRLSREEHVPPRLIAVKYGINPTYCYTVLTGAAWRHIA